MIFENWLIPSADTWYTFKLKRLENIPNKNPSYSWDQISSFIRHDVKGSKDAHLIICLDCPDNIKDILNGRVKESKTSSSLEWHSIFLDALRDAYDESVWGIRDVIRNAEKVSFSARLLTLW